MIYCECLHMSGEVMDMQQVFMVSSLSLAPNKTYHHFRAQG